MVETFWSAIKNDRQTYGSIRKIPTSTGNDYTTEYLLDYVYFQKNLQLIAIDLCKQQPLNSDPKIIQEIQRAGNATIFFINKNSQRNCSGLNGRNIVNVSFKFIWY